MVDTSYNKDLMNTIIRSRYMLYIIYKYLFVAL